MAKLSDLPDELRQRIIELAVVHKFPLVGEFTQFKSDISPPRELIKIRKTCRLFYREALPAFWSANTFAFYVYSGMGDRQHADVARFFTFIARHQMRWIRHLRFYVELPCSMAAPPSKPSSRKAQKANVLDYLVDVASRYESNMPTCTKHVDVELAGSPRARLAPGLQHGCKHEETLLRQISGVLAAARAQHGTVVLTYDLVWSLMLACRMDTQPSN